MKIPFHRPWITEEEINAVAEVMRSGWLTSGAKVLEFEKQFAAFKGVEYAFALNSCTSALFLLLKAHGIGPGDEVITSPNTFAASANTIVHCYAKPVFADIDLNTGNIDPEEIRKKINKNTKAIVVVHLGGNPCDMDSILSISKEYKLILIEDCAHTLSGKYKGKPLGTFGEGAAFSFYPTKNITTGEGGMALVNDPAIAEKIRLLRIHGMNKTIHDRSLGSLQPIYDILEPGYKNNMNDIQAAMGIVQLKRWPEMQKRTGEIESQYRNAFEDLYPKIMTTPGSEPGLHLFTVRVSPENSKMNRNEFSKKLRELGIETSINYQPLHLMSWYQNHFSYKPGDFPFAERWGDTEISLPFYPLMTDEEVQYVISTIQEILS